MRFSTHAGAYEIESVPSQPQMAHCHGFFVPTHLRGQGNAHALKENQNRMLAALGYDFAICTVCGSNTAQKKVLSRAGWEMLTAFDSSKTGEEVELWGWRVKKQEGLSLGFSNATSARRTMPDLGFSNATSARRMMPDESQKAAK